MSKIFLVVRKVTLIATMSALALAAFSATNVFAAGPTTTATSTQAVTTVLAQDWKAEVSAIQYRSEVLSRFDRNSDGVVFHNGVLIRRDEQGKDDATLGQKIFNLWLTKAEAIVSTHAGFDASGMVTDQAQANKSVQDLSIALNQLRNTNLFRDSIPVLEDATK